MSSRRLHYHHFARTYPRFKPFNPLHTETQEWATTLFVRPATIDGIGVPLDNNHQEDRQEGKEGGGVGASVDASVAVPPSSDGVLLFLWDMFFTEGRTALFRIALMILQEAEEDILAAKVGEREGQEEWG